MSTEIRASVQPVETPVKAAPDTAKAGTKGKGPAPTTPKGSKKTVMPKEKAAKAPAAVKAEVVPQESPPARKAAAKPAARPASKPLAAKPSVSPENGKSAKTKKHPPAKPKLVRDSFTLPEDDYALFASLKQRALAGGAEVKKSELLRAGLAMLARADDAEFLKAIGLVERIKTGRPKK